MERFGIIDIGSNSIRLVVYQRTKSGAYRVIDDTKEAARLSERFDENGCLPDEELQYIADILNRFQQLCEIHRVNHIRAVATAAVRNAADRERIVSQLTERTSLPIEVLSGEEEGRLGFLGMINSLDINDGFLIDIGGGSTEVTLFRNRAIVRSVSFPFGAVNTMKRFGKNGDIDETGARAIADMVERAVSAEPWIALNPDLPMVGLGGTMRCLSKIDQRKKQYSLPLTHNYHMTAGDVDDWTAFLRSMKFQKRKRIDGLPKDRADIIVPGLLILQAMFRKCAASHYMISGAGLRDGIFFETLRPEQPQFSDVLGHSVQNLLALHPSVSIKHVQHVERLAMKLFSDLRTEHGFSDRTGVYLHVASLLYRIGISIHYYNYAKHTFYLLAHSRVDGLSHREILLCALIASFKSEKRTKPLFIQHQDLLWESDFGMVTQLGSLLQMAIALDRSETQPIASVSARIDDHELCVTVIPRRGWNIERRELESLEKDFGKIWGHALRISEGEGDLPNLPIVNR